MDGLRNLNQVVRNKISSKLCLLEKVHCHIHPLTRTPTTSSLLALSLSSLSLSLSLFSLSLSLSLSPLSLFHRLSCLTLFLVSPLSPFALYLLSSAQTYFLQSTTGQAGKTSIVKCLIGQGINGVAPRTVQTDGIDIHPIRTKDVEFQCWDFAGQVTLFRCP